MASIYTSHTTTSASSLRASSNSRRSLLSAAHCPYAPTPKYHNFRVEYNGANFNVFEWPHHDRYHGKIIFVHGLGEHAGLYMEYFDRLAHAGFDVFFYEQRGCGDTSYGRDFGKSSGQDQLDDLDYFIGYNAQQRQTTDEQFFLMGQAMGGALCLDYIVVGPHRGVLQAVIVCTPTMILHPEIALSPMLSFFTPLIKRCVPNYKVVANRIKYDHLTSSDKWLTYIKSYEKCTYVSTTKVFGDMLERGSKLLTKEHARRIPDDVGILILHGQNDRVNWIDGSRKFHSNLSGKQYKEYVEIPGARHSLYIERDEILDYVFKKITTFMKENRQSQ